jgi:hypothetical protein
MLGDRRLLAELSDGVWVSGEVFGGFGYGANCCFKRGRHHSRMVGCKEGIDSRRLPRARLLSDIGGSSMVVMLTIQIIACD